MCRLIDVPGPKFSTDRWGLSRRAEGDLRDDLLWLQHRHLPYLASMLPLTGHLC